MVSDAQFQRLLARKDEVRAQIEQERERRIDEAEKQEARDDLLAYVARMVPGYLPGWVHRELSDALMRFSAAVTRGESPRLIVTMPPRSGKSEIVSRRLPVWHLGQNPTHEIILATYGQDLSDELSTSARSGAIASTDLWDHVEPSGTTKVKRWTTKGGGALKSAGVGTAVTGSGGHVIIIDDPVKDMEEALSTVKREKTWSWFLATISTRLAPGGGIIVMATRWHHDDLIGRILKDPNQEDEGWIVVNYPAIALHDEEHRKEGEALHPARYPIEELLKKKKTMGRFFTALYQQQPTPDEGGLYRRAWIRYHDKTPYDGNFDELAISVDATFKGGANSDYVVIQLWGRIGPDFYLLEMIRQRMGYSETRGVLAQFRTRHHGVTMVLIEDKANGSALIDELSSVIPGVIAENPTMSKEARAQLSTHAWESGNVHIPEHAPWLADFESELLSFPAGTHDDMVDCMTQIVNRWIAQSGDALDEMQDMWGALL